MKKILVTGANSYIGDSFANYMTQWPDKYAVDVLDLLKSVWTDKSFSEYDVILHVAGIAHIKETKDNEKLYFEVNRDLVYKIAKKAKQEGIKQFVFLSSMSVYGIEGGIINKNTVPMPISNYGKSKLQAETLIKSLQDSTFNIAILRPPMVYGKGSKGNYSLISKYAKKLPLFPYIQNQRSMIHINNLCEFLRLLINNGEHGTYFPQNSQYVQTSNMVRLISEMNGKKIKLTRIFNPLLCFFGHFIGVIDKVFGNLVYELNMSKYIDDYRIVDFEDSIRITEQ